MEMNVWPWQLHPHATLLLHFWLKFAAVNVDSMRLVVLVVDIYWMSRRYRFRWLVAHLFRWCIAYIQYNHNNQRHTHSESISHGSHNQNNNNDCSRRRHHSQRYDFISLYITRNVPDRNFVREENNSHLLLRRRLCGGDGGRWRRNVLGKLPIVNYYTIERLIFHPMSSIHSQPLYCSLFTFVLSCGCESSLRFLLPSPSAISCINFPMPICMRMTSGHNEHWAMTTTQWNFYIFFLHPNRSSRRIFVSLFEADVQTTLHKFQMSTVVLCTTPDFVYIYSFRFRCVVFVCASTFSIENHLLFFFSQCWRLRLHRTMKQVTICIDSDVCVESLFTFPFARIINHNSEIKLFKWFINEHFCLAEIDIFLPEETGTHPCCATTAFNRIGRHLNGKLWRKWQRNHSLFLFIYIFPRMMVSFLIPFLSFFCSVVVLFRFVTMCQMHNVKWVVGKQKMQTKRNKIKHSKCTYLCIYLVAWVCSVISRTLRTAAARAATKQRPKVYAHI